MCPGRVLGYISDGDVRRPFLGLKCLAWDFFLGLKFSGGLFLPLRFWRGQDVPIFGFPEQTYIALDFEK